MVTELALLALMAVWPFLPLSIALAHWVDWEATGTWVGGIGGVAAVFAALHNARIAREAAQDAQDNALAVRKEAAEDKRRVQADRVYGLIHHAYGKTELRIANRSELPIYSVFLYWMVMGIPPGVDPSHMPDFSKYLGKWEDIEEGLANRALPFEPWRAFEFVPIIPTVPPGREFRVSMPHPFLMMGKGQIRVMSLGLEIVFSDAAGNVWTRRQDGKLEPASSNPMLLPGVQERQQFANWGMHSLMPIDPVDEAEDGAKPGDQGQHNLDAD